MFLIVTDFTAASGTVLPAEPASWSRVLCSNRGTMTNSCMSQKSTRRFDRLFGKVLLESSSLCVWINNAYDPFSISIRNTCHITDLPKHGYESWQTHRVRPGTNHPSEQDPVRLTVLLWHLFTQTKRDYEKPHTRYKDWWTGFHFLSQGFFFIWSDRLRQPTLKLIRN